VNGAILVYFPQNILEENNLNFEIIGFKIEDKNVALSDIKESNVKLYWSEEKYRYFYIQSELNYNIELDTIIRVHIVKFTTSKVTPADFR